MDALAYNTHMTTETKKETQKTKINPFIKIITGVVVGAGIVTASVMSLKNKDNRKKVKKVINKVKTKSQDYLKKAKDFINEDEVKETPKKVVTKKKSVKKSLKKNS